MSTAYPWRSDLELEVPVGTGLSPHCCDRRSQQCRNYLLLSHLRCDAGGLKCTEKEDR